MLQSLFIKVAVLRAHNFIKNRLQNSPFPANISIFLRTAFCMEHFRWLHLKMVEEFLRNSNLTLEEFVQQNV